MTHENLTPRDAFNYPINRMSEPVVDSPRGGPVSRGSAHSLRVDVGKTPKVSWEETQVQRVLREEISQNAALEPDKRFKKAEEILERKLSDKELAAILESHNIGEGEEGKEGGSAEIGNYTREQIARKAKILKDAGFSPEDRRALLESGIAGLPPERFAAMDPAVYADQVQEIASFVKDAGTEANADSTFLQNQISRLDAMINAGNQVTEARLLRNQLQFLTRQAFTQEAEAVEARGVEERERAEQTRFEREDPVPAGANVEDVQRLIDDAREDVGGSRFPERIMEAALRYPETTDRLINRILFKSFEDTTDANRYEINLYAQDNLERLLSRLRHQENGVERYETFIKLRTAAELFHSMNSTMVGGKLEEFIKVAANINYEHFSLMQQLSGAPDVMRLYEEKYQEILAKNKRIATDGYRQLREEVEKSFRALNDADLLRSPYGAGRAGDHPSRLQEWEISRALNAGRTFFNITFRAAEHIANGQLEEGGRKWTGFPQEDAVRLMNWPKWLVERFEVAIPRGGREFIDRTNRNYFEFLDSKRRKLGINRIAELGGMRVDELELGAMFGTSGVYSSWRNETMLFPRIKLGSEPDSQTLRDWLEDEVGYIWDGKTVMAREKNRQGEWVDKGVSLQKRSYWIEQIRGDIKSQDQLLAFLRPVVENVDTGLGVLLRQGILSDEVGYKVRQRIWQRVAETNLPLMINYLSSIRLMDGPIKFTEDEPLRRAAKGEDRIRPTGWNDEQWDEFKQRMLLDHAWKMKNAANLVLPENQRSVVSDQSPLAKPPDHYSPADETALIARIKNEGKALSGDLADILFPYTPFMNDVPFELIDYAGPGETFYKRRSGSDLPSYSAAERAFTSIVNNPGGMGAEAALKAFDEIVKGIESPQGTGDAQERVFPMFSAWGEFVLARPGKRQMMLKAVTEILRQPTSIAQEFAGMDAESFDENQMLAVLGNATKAGIISHDLYNEMKKKKNLGLAWILWALFRDILVMAPVIAVWEMGKDTMKKAA